MKDIPVTKDWVPNAMKSDSLSMIMFNKCKHAESLILNQANQEKSYNINNFDSGVEVEKIIRKSFESLLPKRYKINKGIVCDRDGKTSGEHDIVIFNEQWFPYLTGSEASNKKVYFPIEGIYAIGEVKQTLNFDTLDEGLKKLVVAQRLNRPRVGNNRYTENRKHGEYEVGISNPLFTFLIAVNFDHKIGIDNIFNRFFEINQTLNRQEMIRALCVINEFSISWSAYSEETKVFDIAQFTSRDEHLPLVPTLRKGNTDNISSFYDLMVYLGSHLNSSILGSEDIFVAYGNKNYDIKLPPLESYTLRNY